MRTPQSLRQRPRVESLEARVLYSADPALAAFDAMPGVQPVEHRVIDAPQQQALLVPSSDSTPAETRHELVLVDPRVANWQELVDDIHRARGAEAEVVMLDPARDGIEQIGELLAQEHGLDAVHIISHGEAGALQVGATRLDFDTLLADATAVSRWRLALNSGADLMLYGCDLAASSDGRALVDALSRLTGADVAASTDITGGTSVGGDWTLEYATGPIQSGALAGAADLAAWNESLGLTLTGSDTLVNSSITTGTQLTNSGGINVNPVRATAIDGSGNFVVVWNDPANSGDVYARRFNAAGTALGAQFRVNTTTSATQDGVTVAMNSSGAFVVVWENNSGGGNGDGSGYGIFAQRYDSSGVAQGSNFQINKTTANDQTDPSVAMDSSGNFVVSWTSVGPDSGTTKGVYARRFDASGNALYGSDLLVNTTTAGDQQFSNVSCDANGDFVVAWTSADSNGTGVYARLFNSAGVAQSAEIAVNAYTTDTQDKPSVSMNASGEFVVAWESNLQDGSTWGSYARLYNAAGVAQTGEISLNITTASDQDFPVVAMDSHGNFLASWESNGQDGNSWGVYGRLFDRNGNAVTGETLINSTTTGTQEFPSVAWNGTQAVYVWDGNGPGDATGIFFRAANASIPGITVTPTSGLTTTEAGGTATFDVALISAPTANVTISIASSNASEGTVSTSSLTFTAANWNIAQTVTVTGMNDAVDDGDIAYSIITGAAVSADAGYNGMAVADVALTNVDNDTAGVSVSGIGGTTTKAGGETRVNVNTADSFLERFGRSVAIDPAGNFVVAWTTYTSSDGNAGDVVVRRFAADGTPLSGEIAVNTTTVDQQRAPSVASDALGNFVVCWSSLNQDGSGYGIYAQRFNASGAKLGGEFLVNQTTAGNQYTSSLAMSPTGEFVVTWQASDGGYVRRYAADGTALGNEFRVNTGQFPFSVDMNANKEFVIALTSADGNNIYLQRYDATGVAQGGEQLVNTLAGTQFVPSVAMDDSGNCVVVWTGAGSPAFGRRFDAAGVAQGNQFRVSVTTASAGGARASMDADGSFVVAWQGSDGSGSGTFLRRFAADGTPLTGDVLVNTTVAGSQDSMSVDLSNGSAVVVWMSTDTGSNDVYFQRFQPPAVTTESGSGTRFGVVLNSQPTANVTISVASNDTTEGTVSTSLLTFTAANWNIAQTVTITGVDDAVDDGDIAYSIVTGAAVSADANYNGMAVADVALTNLDNDTARVTVSSISGNTTEAGGTATFSVALTSQPTANVTIAIASNDTTEGTASTSSLIFTAANWNVAQVVTVTGVDDAVVDGNIVYSIVTGAAVSADPGYNGMNPADVAVTNVDNDTAGISVSAISGNTTEGGGIANFSVVLTSQPTADVTIAIASSDTTEGTTSVSSLTFTAANWSVAQWVTVTGVDDAIVDGDVSYSIVISPLVSADASYGGMTVGNRAVVNVDDDTAGITVSPISSNTSEAGGSATFSVLLTSQPTADVTISIASNDTTEGTVSTPSLTFTAANWNVAQVVTVTGVNDAVADGDIDYSIVTGAAASADATYNGMAGADVDLANVDDDSAGITVSPISGNTTEAGGTATFSVALTSQPTANVTISLSSNDTTEGTVSTSSLTFTAANWDVAQQITVTGVDDAAVDGAVAYSIVTGPAVSADASYGGLNATDVTMTNADNDTAGVSVTPTAGLQTTEAGASASFSVVLTSQPTSNVTISVASSDTTEGTVSTSTLVFTSANWNVAQQVTVTGVDDAVADGNVAYSIVTGAAVSADTNYNGLAVADAAVTNLDSDVAAVVVSPISGNTTEAGGSATFSVVLATQPTADVTISLASSNNAEGTVSASSLTFTAANWNAAQVVTVTGVDDAIDDGDAGYSIVTGAAVSADGGYNGLNAADVAVTNIDNDTAGVSISAISGSTTEAGGTATFNVVLDSQPTADVTISIASTDTTEGTVSTSSLTFTAANWNVAQVVSVTGVDDAVDDGNVAYGITTGAATSSDPKYGGLDVADVAVTNLDDDTAGVIVSAISGNTTEAGGTATFTITLASQPAADVTIALAASDATEGAVSAPTVIFSAANWNIAQTVTVIGVDDAVDDGDVTFAVIIGPVTSSDASYNGLNVADVAVTNVDNDMAGIIVSPISGDTTEAGGTANFSIVLTSQPTADVTIAIASNDTTEGTASTSSLTFTAANWNVAQVVTVTGVDDAVADGNVGYSIVTGAAISVDASYSAMAVGDVAVTNVDNDTAGITVSPISGNTTEAGGSATFGVMLTSQPTADVTLSIASSNTAEGTSSVSSLTFTAANWNVAQAVTVTGVDDAIADGNIAYSIVTGPAVSADAGYDGMTVGNVAVTNVDNDTAGITVSPISGNTTEAGGSATFGVALTSQPTADVTISIASNDTTEGTVSTSSLIFTAANWNVAQIVTVTGVDDAVVDGNVGYSIVTGAAVSADPGYNGVNPVDVAATTVDNDAAGVTVSAISGSTTEAGGSANFSVVLNSQPTSDVTIAIVSNDTTEGTVSTSSLTFTAANWNLAQVVTVAGVDDALDDGNVAYSIVTGAASSADASYNGMAVADVALANVDNDTAGVTVSAISGNTSEAGGAATFSVVLTSQPTADVTISLASSNAAEGNASVSSLTFTAADWNVGQTVTVTGVDDAVDDGDVSYSIVTGAAVSADANYANLDAADAAVTNVDNDTAGVTVSTISGNTTEAGGTASFSVALTSQPTADVTISLASGDITEGTVSSSSLTFTAANWNIAQVVTVSGADDAVRDGDVAYIIVTGAASSADAGYSGIAAADVAVTNVDDDISGISISPMIGSTTEAGGTGSFGVMLTSQPIADVTISLASSNTAEGSLSVASLTFTAANWNVAQTITVTGVDDAVDDGDVAYSIIAGSAVSADANYNGAVGPNVGMINVDNDTAGISVSPIGNNTSEAGGTATFGVVLTSQPTADITIPLASSNTAEGTPSVSSLTFTAANWNVAQAVTVTGADDAMADGDVAYSIITGAAVSADANYSGMNAADVAVTNVDNDTAGVSVSAISGNTTEAGGAATFSVVLASQPSADVTITIASSDSTEGAASTSSLTFTAANWSVAQVVSVTGVDDTLVDGDIAYSIVTSAAASADAHYSGIAVNDVAVTNVDDERAPMLALPASLEVDEDTSLSLGAAGLSVTDANGDLTRVDLAVTHGSLTVDLSGGASIIAASAGNRSVSLAGTQAQLIDALGRTTYRGDADWSGNDTLNISAVDANSLQAGGSVAIHVSPVNDAPVITSAAHVDIPEGQVAVTRVTSSDVEADVPHYAIVGGADAARFVIDNNSGELRLRDAPDAEAPADADRDNVYEVIVEVSDGEGGTARQGLDVKVLGVNEAPSVSVAGLSVPVDGAVTLTPRQIIAHDVDSPTASLTYSVTGVVNGHFELATQPGTAISTFSQSALDAGLVSFVHDAGTPAPQFVITVSDGQANSAPLWVQATISSSNPAPAPHTGTPDHAPPAPEPMPTAEPASPPDRPRVAAPSASRTETPDLPRAAGHSADDSTGVEPGAESTRRPFVAPSPAAASREDDLDGAFWRGEESRRGMLLALFDATDSGRAKELEASDTPHLELAHQPEEDVVHLELGAVVLQTLGIALTAGSVWWALRATGLVTALLASLPAWRQLDFLPVLAEEEGDDAPRWSPAEDAEAARDEAAVERDLFAEGVSR
jgi:hypothetical protein